MNFQAAVSSRTIINEESKISLQQPKEVKAPHKEKRSAPPRPLASLIRVKPQPKKVKVEKTTLGSQETADLSVDDVSMSTQVDQKEDINLQDRMGNAGQSKGLVSYAMDSDDEDD